MEDGLQRSDPGSPRSTTRGPSGLSTCSQVLHPRRRTSVLPYGGVLLTAAGIDGNDQIILLGWVVVPQEPEEWWRWFLNHWKAPLVSFESFELDGSQAIAL